MYFFSLYNLAYKQWYLLDYDFYEVSSKTRIIFHVSMNYLDIQLKLTVFLVLYLKYSVVSSYPPTFAEEPKNRTINAGSGALFRCKADGRPTPRVTVSSWLKDGQPLSQRDLSSGRLKVYTSSGSLQFVRTRREDSGNYTCVIRNTQGVNTSSAILVVKGVF